MSDRPLPWLARVLLSFVVLGSVPRVHGQEGTLAGSADEHARAGETWIASGQFDKAIEEYTEAIRLDPKRAGFYHRRGLLYKRTQSFSRAEGDFSALIRLKPTAAEGYYLRGTCHLLGPMPSVWARDDAWKSAPPDPSHARAIADLSEAIRLDPRLAKAYFARAAEYAQVRHDCAHAVADFDAAIRLSPPGGIVAYYYWSRGYVLALFKSDHARAIADYTQALKVDANMPMAYATRACAYHKLGKLKEAVDDYSAAIALNPRYGFALRQRAEVYMQMGERKKAEDDLARARDLPVAPFAMPSKPW